MAVTTLLGLPIPQMSDSVGKTIPDLASAMQIIDEKLGGSRIVDHNLDVASPPNGYYVRWENGLQICSAEVLQSYQEGTKRYTIQTTYASAFQRVIGSGVSPRIASAAGFQFRLLTFGVDALAPTQLRAHIQVTEDSAAHLAIGFSYIVIGTWK